MRTSGYKSESPDRDLSRTILANTMSSQTPDLASILKTLASLAPQSQQQQIQPPQQPHLVPAAEPFPAEQVWQQSLAHATQPSCTPTPSSATKLVDPSTIIEWSAGLRCVMKQVAKHENIIQDVRRVCFQAFFLNAYVSQHSDDQGSA